MNISSTLTTAALFVQTLQLLLLLLAGRGCWAKTIRCISCMSEFYGAMWEDFRYDQIFVKQMDFNNKCKDPSKDAIGLRHAECETSCVLLMEPLKGGGKLAYGYVRGCYDSFFKNGFNRTSLTATRMEYRELCGNFSLNSLAHNIGPREAYVFACTCLSDLCNRSHRRNCGNSARLVLLTSLLLLLTIPFGFTYGSVLL